MNILTIPQVDTTMVMPEIPTLHSQLFSLSVCMLTVSNALLMSSVTVIVRSGGLFWLKPVGAVNVV